MSIFQKIISGEIDSYKIYEDEDLIAILDISQVTYGHTLVIPKKYTKNILDTDDETLSKMIKLCAKLTKLYEVKLGAKGFNIVHNCNEFAGQSVDHIHFHIVPRYENDNFKINFQSHKFDLKEIQDKILK